MSTSAVRSDHRRYGLSLVCAVSLIIMGCASMSDINSARTSSERSLLPIAGKIRGLAGESTGDRKASDQKLERLLAQAHSVWQASPSRSATTFSGSGYENEIVVLAVADYYVATGRTGLAIPVIEAGADEARSLRYYAQWQSLTLELVKLYQRVGMLDHARDRIASVLKFLERFGHTISNPPDRLDRDTVLFVTLHATQLEIRPGDYQDTADLERLYDLYARSADASPEAWGWQPETGYRYAALGAPFAVRFAQLGDLAAARRVRAQLAEIHRRNRTLDPFVLANQLHLNSSTSMLGRDLHRVLGRPIATKFLPLAERLQTRPPSERRYLAREPFVEHFERARIDLALGNLDTALEAANIAQASLEPIAEFYARMGSGFAIKDGHSHAARALSKTRAAILEALSRYAEAEKLYDNYIAWSERERSSLPVDQRVHFFRGQARAAYLGSIRCALEQYLSSDDPAILDRVLKKAELLRARGFQDLLGIDSVAQVPPTRKRLQAELDRDAGILQLVDLDDRIATILLTAKSVRVQSFAKPPNWDRGIFRLRNQLAESEVYDRRGFDELGRSLLGFAAKDLESLTRLYVTTDGALSALPITILPFAPGRMLHEKTRVTLVPSLSLWLSHRGDIEPADTSRARVFALADPTFDADATIAERIGKDQMAMRGLGAMTYFQRLPETADEVRAIISAFEQTTGDRSGNRLLLGAEASESRLKAEPNLADYTYLHFATHGVIGNDLPNLSEPALILAWEEQEDGFLTAREVTRLKLNARLTVLSACNTGNGEYFAGEGLMGMGRAFMLAGSDRVLVSLWPVESFSTQRLMELFYARLALGESEDQALWQAQKDLQRDVGASSGQGRGIAIDASRLQPGVAKRSKFDSPFYWSPFVLISAH